MHKRGVEMKENQEGGREMEKKRRREKKERCIEVKERENMMRDERK